MSCNKPCNKICQIPDITPEERAMWTGIKKLDCNDYTYMNSIIRDLERAKRKKDIMKILAYARELERIKILCGNTQDETVERFERAIGLASETVNLQTCKVIKRSLEPSKPEPKCTMIGFGNFYEIHENPDGSKSLIPPESEPKPKLPKSPIHISELRHLSRNQTRIKESEKSK